MATSGNYTWTPSTYGPGVGYPNRAKITWNATWNQSAMLWTVNWNATAQGASTAGRWTTVYGSNNGCNSYITVTDANGNVLQTKSIVAKMETVKNDTVLLEGSFNVGVDVYGNQSLTFAGQINFETTGSAGISSGSQAFALDNIPLASTISSISPSSVAVTTSGGAVTVNIARNNNAYTHTVVWAFGSHSQTQTGQGTSASYTIPASWLDAIPNATSGTASVRVTTYSGSTQIGNPTTASFTITAAVNPSIGSVSVSPSGNPSGITQYIAGYTKAAISASSVSGVQGSTIKKVEFLNGSTVLSSNTTPSYSYTTGAVSGSSATFGVRVTDSRGKTATKSASAVTIAAYAVPTIYANAYRSDSSGTAQTDGTYLKVTASATATPSGTGGNSITALKYSYKATTSSSWSAEADIPSGAVSGFANTTSYDVRVRAQDAIGNSSYRYFTIPTAEYTMDFKVGGKGVAFGKVAETDNLVDSAWAFRTSHGGNNADAGLTVEHGTTNKESTVEVKRTDVNRDIALMVGAGGTNRGLYVNDGNMDGWLVYYDDNNLHLEKPLALATPLGISAGGTGQAAVTHLTSGVITRTSGATLTSQDIAIWGKVIVIRLLVTTTTSYSAGTNMFEGTIASGYRPVMSNTSGGGYYSNAGIIVQAQDTGGINARVISNSIPSGAQIGFSITYIMA